MRDVQPAAGQYVSVDLAVKYVGETSATVGTDANPPDVVSDLSHVIGATIVPMPYSIDLVRDWEGTQRVCVAGKQEE